MQIYNQLTRRKEEFIPLIPGEVKIYACGPTVYNYFHIGNARAFITFDVLRRYLEYRGFKVTYVQNITDIDDKIINQSIDEGVPFSDVAAKYTQAFLDDSIALGIGKPTHQPRATQVMSEIIDLISALVQRGHAYEVNGDVYFDTHSLPEYGHLSGKNIEEQLAGARVQENIQKKNPSDFTLWKRSKPGEPIWTSPWGDGRPGWHTECVVMSRKYLGDTFDIHGGGVDLLFPHHENELAQALALTGKPLANYWMYNGFLNVDGEKMSKSLNNFFTARDILKEFSADAIRFFFLSKHYRSPIDFNREIMEESSKAVSNFYQALQSVSYKDISTTEGSSLKSLEADFVQAMDDDLNTAKALAVLFELCRIVRNEQNQLNEREQAALLLVRLGRVIGFFRNLDDALPGKISNLDHRLIELLLAYRGEARRNKDWAMSDRIRNDLLEMGIEIKDTPAGCTWYFKMR